MRLLLLSNSTMAGQAYLDYPKEFIREFLGDKPVNALFIPYAVVTFSYDEYESKVKERFLEIGHNITSIHQYRTPKESVKKAEAIVVGGGNTWQLVRKLYQLELMPLIREKALTGIPYIGWSAGANIACPTLRTTNDMPIVDPVDFRTLGLVPFQINPHYIDTHPKDFTGETREQRIMEFLKMNPDTTVVGLREGCLLKREGNNLELLGHETARQFRYGHEPKELMPGRNINFLLS